MKLRPPQKSDNNTTGTAKKTAHGTIVDDLSVNYDDTSPPCVPIGTRGLTTDSPRDLIAFLDASPIPLSDGPACLSIPKEYNYGTIANIIKQQTAEAQLASKKAEIDDLTGVYRRNAGFNKSLELMLNHLRTLNMQYLYLFFDIDDFGMINKVFGQLAGDAALQVFAEALHSAVKKALNGSQNFVVTRLGGEEFGVAVAINDRITVADLSSLIFDTLNQEIFNRSSQLNEIGVSTLTASAGVATHFTGNITVSSRELLISLQETANFAAIQSKQKGKNQISIS